MPRWLRSSTDRVRAVPAIVLVPAGLTVGIAAESRAYAWSDVHLWLPDLIVGLVFVTIGARMAGERAMGLGVLFLATGAAWFAGTLAPGAVLWHRGPFVHILATYAGWKPENRLAIATVVAGYGAAVAGLWSHDIVSIVLAAALVAAVARLAQVGQGQRRAARSTALRGAVVFGTTIAVLACIGLAVPSGTATDASLVAYELMLCAVAIGLAARLPDPAATAVVDLVVELGDGPSGSLRNALAEVLGDPAIEVGFWSAERSFADAEGREIELPPTDPGRVATYIEQAGEPLAVIVHDEMVLREPAVVAAVAAAARLSAVNASLNSEVRRRLDDLIASRRRLVAASDDERARLEHTLRTGAERRLGAIATLLDSALSRDDAGAAHGTRARRLLTETIADLHVLARGLHPRELDGGLEPALRTLASRCPIPVRLHVDVRPLGAELSRAVYFVCSESLANATKHADASLVTVAVTSEAGVMVVRVSDDGGGGADPSLGSGLSGLADRVAALGGTFRVDGNPGGGTLVTARLPV